MRRFALTVLLAGIASASVAAPLPDGARECATRFGRALERGDAAALRPLLPARGKVRVSLDRLGPGEGGFSAGQVEAILADFRKHGSVRAFELSSPESPGEGYALIRGRATVVDRSGMPCAVDLHLTVEPENGRWVLRDIRESRR